MAKRRCLLRGKVKTENSKVWCLRRVFIITAPNTKGQKEAEKGLKGKI